MKHIFIGLMVVALIGTMMKGKAAVSADGQRTTLRYHRLAIGVALAGMGMGLWLAYKGYQMPEVRTVFFIAACFFFLPELLFLMVLLQTRVELDQSSVTSYGLWGEPVVLHWMEVERVDFKGSKFIITGLDGRTRIKIGMLMSGIDSLVEAFKQRLPEEKFKQSVINYHKLVSRY